MIGIYENKQKINKKILTQSDVSNKMVNFPIRAKMGNGDFSISGATQDQNKENDQKGGEKATLTGS